MTKASSIFDVFPWANWISKDIDGRVYAFEKEPKKTDRFWVQINGNMENLGIIHIDEFKDKDWKECIIERPKEVKTWEDLQEWAKGKEGVNVRDTEIEVMRKKVDVKVYGDKEMGESDAYILYGGRPTLDAFFAGTPAQVKRVLEAMLND